MTLVDKKGLRKIVPFSPQHIARLERAGRFPKRIRLGPNRVAWLLSEVEKWIEDRVAASRETNPETGNVVLPSGAKR